MSWILLDDLVDVVHAALADTRLAGPVNAVAPRPVEQRELARTLGRVLRRPAVLPLPAFAVSMLLGEMGRELLLSGAYVLPARLQAAGFRWRAPDLEPALRRELGRLGSSQ